MGGHKELACIMEHMDIPKEIQNISQKLADAGHRAYLVGGCTRDLLLGKAPNDWDIATDAKPEEIQGLFKDAFYENEFGTVGVKSGSEDPTLKVVEVTTFRKEGRYTDKRHPDEIKFAKTIEEDGRMTAIFRWYKIVYREFRLKDIRKIYPITVYAKI